MSSTGSKVVLADGRWVVLRAMRGHDIKVFAGDDYGAVLDRLDSAVVEKSWDGDLLEEELEVLTDILKGWRSGSEDAAVPPAEGES